MHNDAKRLNLSRRHFLKLRIFSGSALLLPNFVLSNILASTTHTTYLQTINALQASYQNEVGAHRHFVAFSRKAKDEDYPNISYLFTTFATSEFIHSRIFRMLLIDLGVNVQTIPEEILKISHTKTNQKNAAEHEIQLIDKFYPEKMGIIQKEKHQTALTGCRYSWESHMQHRDQIYKINKWSNRFFQIVANIIARETGFYFVCHQCGSTLAEIPGKICPICYQTSDHYRKIERDAFFEKALV